MECSLCGISDKMRNVSQVLAPKGIIFACDRCARNEGLIFLKKPKVMGPGEEKHESVYERMARLAGVKPKEQPDRPWLRTQEKSLREIVDKNYEKKIAAQAGIVLKPRQDLVDNFHWIIMRVRRVKGLTQGQLAERVSEPEAAIKMAEQGVVPEGYELIDKLERFLHVRLIRERNLALPLQRQQHHLTEQLHQPMQLPVPQPTQQIHQQTSHPQQHHVLEMHNIRPPTPTKPNEKALVFDKYAMESLTIADLKRLKQEREAKKEQPDETVEEEIERKEEHEQSRPYDRLDYE